MIRRTIRARGALRTRSERTVIFDGTDRMCADRYGFKTAGGRTFSHLVMTVPETNTIVPNVWFAASLPAAAKTVFVNKSGEVYTWDVKSGATKTVFVVGTVKPFVIPCNRDGVNAYIIYGGNRVCIAKYSSLATRQIDFKLYCGDLHHGRAFVNDNTDRYLVHWSDTDLTALQPGIDKGGNIRLNPEGGEVMGIFSFGEQLIILRKTCLCVMHASGDPRDFSFEQSKQFTLPTVLPYSSVICGGKLWIYTADGLFSYNGSTLTRKPLPDFAKGYRSEEATAVGGRYIYYSLESDEDYCIMEYDTAEDSFTRIADFCHMVFESGGRLFCFTGTVVRELTAKGGDENYFWRSVNVDLGTAKGKTLKKLIAEGEGGLTFEVDCDGRKHTVTGFGSHAIGERATNFVFTVRGAGALTKLTAEWEVNE